MKSIYLTKYFIIYINYLNKDFYVFLTKVYKLMKRKNRVYMWNITKQCLFQHVFKRLFNMKFAHCSVFSVSTDCNKQQCCYLEVNIER